MSIKYDPHNIEHLSKKILPEDQMRKNILNHAKYYGYEKEMIMLLDKYDRLLKACTNSQEREELAKYACYKVYELMGKGEDLYLNNKLYHQDSFLK